MKWKILITGGYGFIGSNFINYIIKNYSNKIEFPIINIDKCTYAANPKYIEDNENKKLVKSYIGDIIDYYYISNIIINEKPNLIINFAAETHVDNSNSDAKNFIYSNYVGVYNLIELCKQYNIKFHQVSTDEVYGSAQGKQCFIESDKLNPSSPYSATKAAADLLIKSYIKVHNIDATISFCTNNYGLNQHQEKLIPKTILNILNNEKIPIYGDGKQIRNWIYVNDHCSAIWKIINEGKSQEFYNVAGNSSLSNLYLIKQLIYKITGKKDFNLIEFIKDRPAHDIKYSINDRKIRKFWQPNENLGSGLNKTIEYYRSLNVKN